MIPAYNGGQYVQEKNAEGIVVGIMCRRGVGTQCVEKRSTEGLTVGSMCRRSIWRVW